jgi:hypothetical protein
MRCTGFIFTRGHSSDIVTTTLAVKLCKISPYSCLFQLMTQQLLLLHTLSLLHQAVIIGAQSVSVSHLVVRRV